MGVVEADSAGFVVAIPYPNEAETLRITHNGQVLGSINPNSSLLRTAVEYIPKESFIGPSDQRRKALYNKINEFEAILDAGYIQDAYNKLTKDIRDKVNKWLNDYSKENPGQLTKTEILELIDEIAGRLRAIGNL
jgi:hypothetical protein